MSLSTCARLLYGDLHHSNPSCDQRLKYEQALEYLDISTSHFICPSCNLPMHKDQKASSDVEGNRRLNAANSQLIELRKNFELLKEEYQSVQDYPRYTKPTSVESSTAAHAKAPGKRQARDHSITKRSPVSRRIESGPLPWELDSEDEVPETTSVENSVEATPQFDIFCGVESQRSEFMHSAKTFIHREASVVPESPETSPITPMVFKIKKTKAALRSTATPF